MRISIDDAAQQLREIRQKAKDGTHGAASIMLEEETVDRKDAPKRTCTVADPDSTDPIVFNEFLVFGFEDVDGLPSQRSLTAISHTSLIGLLAAQESLDEIVQKYKRENVVSMLLDVL